MNTNRRLLILTSINMACVSGLWLIETYVAERHWLTTLITYVPQHWAGLPLLVLLPWALIRRAWLQIGLSLLSLGVVIFGPLGLCLGVMPRFAHDHKPVRVMTWNIHHASRGMDGIMRVVKAEGPDVVCFQEANDGYWKSDVLPELRKAFKGWHCSEFREVVTFSKCPIVTERVHRLMPETGRAVLETVLDIHGERLAVYNTHLNVAIEGRSLKGSGLRGMPNYLRHTAEVRADQIRDLKQVVSTSSGRSVIAGDFNTPPRGRCYRWIAGRYKDSFKHGGRGFGYTYPTRRPLMRIDYIFADDGIDVRRCFVPRTSGSDHRPVIAELVLSDRR